MSSNVLQLTFNRFPWLLHVAFLAAFSFVGAQTANLFTAQKIRPDIKAVSAFSLGQKSQAKPELTAEAFADMMGLTLPEPPPPAAAGSAGETPQEIKDRNNEPVRTSLRAQLLATILANRPEWSIATLRDLNQNQDDVYMVDDLFMGAKILKIEQLRVIILNEGQREFIDLSPPGTAAAPPKPMATADVRPQAANTDGVKQIDANHYTIQRSTVDNALTNMNELAMSARIVPSFKNGTADGFKLFSIRPDSLYSKIGVQNGDVIQKINGLDINSPDKALEAYGKLKSAGALDLTIERNGTPQNIHYAIQ